VLTARTGETALRIIAEGALAFVVLAENMIEAGGVLTGTQTTRRIDQGDGGRRGDADLLRRKRAWGCRPFECTGKSTEEDRRKIETSEQAGRFLLKDRFLRVRRRYKKSCQLLRSGRRRACSSIELNRFIQ
jgi:hypothetical protein